MSMFDAVGCIMIVITSAIACRVCRDDPGVWP